MFKNIKKVKAFIASVATLLLFANMAAPFLTASQSLIVPSAYATMDGDGDGVPSGMDCDDTNDTIYPGAFDIPDDGIDQDCNSVDMCYLDADDDGYRPNGTSTVNGNDLDCSDATEAVSSDPIDDCNDTDASINPSAFDIPDDSIDQDCDGSDAITVPECGNGILEEGEDCITCEADAGFCGPVCGDASCDLGEDFFSCPDDCPDGGGGGECVADDACTNGQCGGEQGYSSDGGSTCYFDPTCSEAMCDLPPTPAFIFITSTTYGGNLQSLITAERNWMDIFFPLAYAGFDAHGTADADCMDRAAAAGLDGTWKGLISTTGPDTNASELLPDKPYFLLNGVQVAESRTDLLDGAIMNPIYLTEYGTPYSNYPGHPGLAWTGSNAAGNLAIVDPYANLNCSDWSVNTSDGRAIAGLANATDSNWIDGIPENDGAMHCGQQAALYCFSGDSSGMGAPEICDNGIDDNDNGSTDCADMQCAQMPICGGGGGQCIDMNGTLDGDSPFEGGFGEACDGTAFRPGHDTCQAFGYEGGTLGCSICTPDFSQCTGGDKQMGAGQINVNLKDEAGDPYVVSEDTAVTVACGNTTTQIMQEGGGQVGLMPSQSDSFFIGAMVSAGESTATVMGIPTPQNGEIFANPCLVFLGQSASLTLGSQYAYTGGLGPVGWTDYLQNITMDKPMPPMAKYASVSLGNDPDNVANLDLKVQGLTSGDLSGKICLGEDLDSDAICDEGYTLIDGMQVSMFPLSQLPPGAEMPGQAVMDGSYYSFGLPANGQSPLPGGDYVIEAFGPYMYFGTVTINGSTAKDIIISTGAPLTLTLDDTAEACWTEGMVRYSFWPENWTFNSRPVFGEVDYNDPNWIDNGDGTWSLNIDGFADESYNGYVEVPGCVSNNESGVNPYIDSELYIGLSTGITLSGTVVDGNGDPVPDFQFGAQTVSDDPSMFGSFTSTMTGPDGSFQLSGLTAGDWTFQSFESGLSSQRSFASNEGSLVDGIYSATGDASGLTLVLQSDKRVNITVTDGLNQITDAMIDISCDTGKYIHLGHSNGVYAFLPPSDTCKFSVHARSGSYQPLNNYPVTILTGLQPQNVSLTLSSYNTNQGTYTGSTFKSDKTTTNPGGTVNYVGHAYNPNPANLAGKTVTFIYPTAASGPGSVVVLPQAGTCNNTVDGTVTCSIPGGYANTSYDVSYAVTIDTAYAESSLSTAFSVAGTNIGNVFVEVTKLAINAPGTVGIGENFTVYGTAYPDSTVSLSYLDSAGAEIAVGSTIMEPGSTWYSFGGVSIADPGEYTLKVTAVGTGVSTSVTRAITVGGGTPNITDNTFTAGGTPWVNNPMTGNPAGQIFEGNPFTVDLTFSDPVDSVTGGFQGGSYDFTTSDGGSNWTFDMPPGWTGYGNGTFDVNYSWDDDADAGTPSVDVPYGPVAEPLVLIDPSGYVYDTVDANRIADVSATVYQLYDSSTGNAVDFIDGADTNVSGVIEDSEELANQGSVLLLNDGSTDCSSDGVTLDGCTWSQWNASPSGQINPQLTDINGRYGWNVPAGWYRVSFQKAGAYSLNYSRDIYVPPAETTLNLNIGAYDVGRPTVTTNPAHGAMGIARNVNPTVMFSEPMLAGTINTTNIKLLDADNADANVAITVTYDSGNNTATLVPIAPPLAGTHNYTIRVLTGVADDSSNTLGAQVDSGFQTSATTDITAPTSAATPAGTTFTSAQVPFAVTLGADDGGGANTCADCTIYYTTDGTAPTTSSAIYTGPFALKATTIIKFFAKDAANNSEAAPRSETYTLTTAPAVPTGLAAASLTNGYISLTWNGVVGATSYKVYRSETSGVYIGTLATGITGALYSDTTAVNGTTYYYKVAAVNAAGDSALSAEANATSTVTTQQQQQQQTGTTTGGGGGGGGTGATSSSNTTTSTVATIVSTITGNQTYGSPLQLKAENITVDADSNTATAPLTGNGTLTLKPNSGSTISAIFPPNTDVTGPADWNGRIDPPVVQSLTLVNSTGDVIDGSKDKLMRDDVAAIVKVGANVPLTFSNEVTLEIPLDLPNGSVVLLYTSLDGVTWTAAGEGVVENGVLTVKTDHFTYFAVAMTAATKALAKEPVESVFKDIIGHWAEAYIQQLADLGVVSGKTATSFAPDANITRAELTKIATKAFNVSVNPSPASSSFSDVPLTEWFAPYVIAARDAGIVQGISDGVFAPNAPVDRAAALKIILKSAGYSETTPEQLFSDVAVDDWFAGYVTFASRNGIVSGRTAATFAPADNITRAEVAKIVVNVMNLPIHASANEGEPAE